MQTPADGLRRVTREEMSLIDSMASAAYGIPALALMENAGREVAEAVLDLLRERNNPPGPVAVFASTGHNGGDGLVAARHLANAGREVRVLVVGRKPEVMSPESAGNLRALRRMGVPVAEVRKAEDLPKAAASCLGSAAVVDALLGTGFSAISGGLREPIASAIDAIGTLGAPVVSADIPSGLDANTGEVIGKAVRAERTVAFGLPKEGFFRPGAADFVGRLTVSDIGIPRVLLDGRPSRA